MTAVSVTEVSLPDEAKAVIWRMFGAGESPRTERSTFDLIEKVICKYVSSSAHQGWAISTIRGWFETIGERQWLKPDMREPVAVLILEGIGTDRSETAIWAIGSIDRDLAASMIGSLWRPVEIDSFVDAALATLEKNCMSGEILNATGIVPSTGIESGKTRIPREAVQREGRLETFQHLSIHGFDLIHRALHPSAGNLIELVVDLQPERFESLIEQLDHPVLQARAACHMVAATRSRDHRKPLLWITENSCDSLIALAIMHTLETVNRLDEDIRSSDLLGEDRLIWSTELRLPQDDLDAAVVNLLSDLVDRLAMLAPLACAQWIGELLSGAPYALMRGGDFEKPPRIELLEELGTKLLARLVRHSWSDELLAALSAGLCLTPRTTWTRHVAEVAWEVRDVEPARAATLAQAALNEHERHVADQLEHGRIFLNWDDWHGREWIAGLGAALALSSDELDMIKWVTTICRELPLSVWDAEESHRGFSTADRAAQIWFLVALHAVGYLKQIGRAVDPIEVRALAEAVWSHRYFARQYLTDGRDASVASEHAARTVVELGEPSSIWLLEQARDPRVGPRVLWALIDQRKKRAAREGGPDQGYDEMVVDEFAHDASVRFGDGEYFDFESLHYWGRLWLLLGVSEPAYRTAKEILAFPMRNSDRGSKILVLELLTLAADGQRLDQETMDYVGSTYRELWPAFGYAPHAEQADRQRIDELLKRLGIPVP